MSYTHSLLYLSSLVVAAAIVGCGYPESSSHVRELRIRQSVERRGALVGVGRRHPNGDTPIVLKILYSKPSHSSDSFGPQTYTARRNGRTFANQLALGRICGPCADPRWERIALVRNGFGTLEGFCTIETCV